MASVDQLIDAIDNRDELAAQELLEQQPALAIGESFKEGVLRGATPLHWAAHRNMTNLCERLIQSGADANARQAQWWRTPLAWAADAGCAEAVELLLRDGADVNGDAFGMTTALHAAAQGGSTSGQENSDTYRRTALSLITNGVDINRRATGDRDQTALDDAIRKGNEAVIEVLVEHGGKTTAELRLANP